MASSPDNLSMAVFCDFENVALGVRDAKYDKFDIKPVLERLLLKGSIVVKKAYCDWDRYKSFKAGMHEANFELIEIPHVRQSGKNSADIRLVVDALDLCYTKSHVNTFVIISGDSDFSPLVSKLRENAKQVIGVGIKQSTSDLLVANCDEFIFYDDLVRESRRAAQGRGTREAQPATRRTPEEEQRRREEKDARRNQAIEIAVHTFDALVSERGDSGKIWASLLKEAIKRRKPDFSESNYGFRTFGNLLEEAQARGLLEFGRDEKSGTFVYKSSGAGNAAVIPAADKAAEQDGSVPAMPSATTAVVAEEGQAKPERRRSRGGRKPAAKKNDTRAGAPDRGNAEQVPAESAALKATPAVVPVTSQAVNPQPVNQAAAITEEKAEKKTTRKTSATGRTKKAGSSAQPSEAAPAKPERKPATRARGPRKTKAAEE
ncbi:MAG: NYN domain-containing protein [Pseudomonadota bacterium]